MNSNNVLLSVFALVTFSCVLVLTSCTSPDNDETSSDSVTLPRPRLDSAMSSAQRSLALVYLEKAGEMLIQVNDAETVRQTDLMIAHAYAYLGDVEKGSRFLKPTPPFPSDDSSYNDYLQYVSILAALGQYEEIESCIKRLETTEAEASIRGYVVYYDALLGRNHLQQSLKAAAACIDARSDPYSIFTLAFGYQMAGNPVQSRKTCLMSNDPHQRFVACSYMAATLGMAGEIGEATFYLDQAGSDQAHITDETVVDSYTLMIYGRALAFSGRLEEATLIYTRLSDQIEALYVGSVLAEQLRDTGHPEIAQTIIRNSKAKFDKFREQTDRKDYLYNCYGDFLITLGLFPDLDSVLKQTSDPLLKSNLLIGGAQALADEIVYQR